jgi:hypothetical protein
MTTTKNALSADAADALATDGFVVLPGPYPSGQFSQLQDAYDNACAQADPDDVRVGRTSTSRVLLMPGRCSALSSWWLHAAAESDERAGDCSRFALAFV